MYEKNDIFYLYFKDINAFSDGDRSNGHDSTIVSDFSP